MQAAQLGWLDWSLPVTHQLAGQQIHPEQAFLFAKHALICVFALQSPWSPVALLTAAGAKHDLCINAELLACLCSAKAVMLSSSS